MSEREIHTSTVICIECVTFGVLLCDQERGSTIPSTVLLHYSIYIREGERLQSADVRAQELCESRGGRSGLVQSLIVCTISMDVKQHLKKSLELLSPSWDN